jgi:hypothetical protein
MAKFDLKFIDYLNNDDYIKTEKFYSDDLKKELISIKGMERGKYFAILLDKSTAIKFAKTLRT